MSTNNREQDTILLTTGMFDLLKAQITRKKLNPINELQISSELKHAKQVLRKDLPGDVVDVYKSVKILDQSSGKSKTYNFVPPNVARSKNGTTSILSDIGLAVLGYQKGATLQWDTPNGMQVYEIESVMDIES